MIHNVAHSDRGMSSYEGTISVDNSPVEPRNRVSTIVFTSKQPLVITCLEIITQIYDPRIQSNNSTWGNGAIYKHSIACTWNRSLIRSSGADAVRAMMPAAPPAAAWREPMATAYMRLIKP